jgi:chorismate mutase-like protein
MPTTRKPKTLESLRAEIDALDDRIHEALIQRAELSLAVREVKGGGGAALRPGREAAILRRLVERHRGALPGAVIVRLWREILAASVRLQGPFAVAVASGAAGGLAVDLARTHFGPLTTLHASGSAAAVLNELAEGRAKVGVVALPEDAPAERWWRGFGVGPGAGFNVIGRLPVAAAAPGPAALMVARQPFDPSTEDRGYAVLETSAELSHARVKAALEQATLSPVGFPAAVDDAGGGSAQLIELASRLDDDDPRPTIAAKALGNGARLRAIGGYAIPIALDRS